MAKFEVGNQAAKGHGRPPKAREAALLAIAHEILNAQTWRQVVTKRVLDALGKKQETINEQVRLVDDPDSTAQGRNQAATWLRDTVIGKPTEYVNLETDESAYDLFSAYSENELEQIQQLLRQLRPDSGSGELDSNGIGETPTGENAAGDSV